MSSKLSVSLAAAVALSAAAGGVARADPNPTSFDDGRVPAQSPMDAGVDATQMGNPVGGYRDRVMGPPTNDQVNAAEAGSPDSIDNKDQRSPPADGNEQELESGSPDKP
jgi:hypothetical protein